MALLPLIVLMPMLLVLAMTRWTADYDDVLIAKVESDLRIAEQYLGQIMAGTGASIQAVSNSTDFLLAAQTGDFAVARHLADMRDALSLDFLYFLPSEDLLLPAKRWPVIATAGAGMLDTQIDILSNQDLRTLSPEMMARARLPLIPTEAAVPTDRTVEDRGMVVHSAAPVAIKGHEGVLVGGILLNRNLQFIDTINALVYQSEQPGVPNRQGTATLFLEDVRVSTNVRLFEDVRALGTRVSAVVRNQVLNEGRTWLDRAFVVNDWYISGYLPIVDSFGGRVGMLYVGFLESPYNTAKRAAYWAVLASFAAVVIISAPLFLYLAKGIFSPLERMTNTMQRVEDGDLAARISNVSNSDEIGQVATHLNELLDQVQERDRTLRSWADELNDRVDRRTAELHRANQKLEDTFQQLVMSEKLASIGEITAGVAHEINNPVAVIQGNVDVIRESLGENAAPVETELNLIDRQIVRIGAIVGKLLQFARPGEFGDFAESIDLSVPINDSLVLVKHQFVKQDITLEQDQTAKARVLIDPGEFQQVVINLIINAVQAMGDCKSGTLKINTYDVERDGKAGVCMTVSDTGPGIALDKINAVFDPFLTTKSAEGTGLGLSISQTIIQEAGGLITAANQKDGGAIFTVWLPAHTNG
ncbi:sensor signal transduction histidine kinase [Actibacterium atlanticum]|uniref:histidine kinase n=2 Tax=Actibacterium atlanticum TaxID=1461693 RepID=A0A058ZJP0_9RHOB|nr:sensor signal transduction histidine kinase [Actibacterium atlanticum]